MVETALELRRKIYIYSLQKLCLIKLSSIVCNHEDVLDLILKCHYYEFLFDRLQLKKTKKWKAAQNKAYEIISQISSNAILQEKIKELFWPMSYRVIIWKHTYATYLTHEHLRHTVWTDVGEIDTVSTAKHIIENKNVDIRYRFIFACKLCLSEEIHSIFHEMSDKDKRYYSTKYRGEYRPLLVFWDFYTVLGSCDKHCCFNALQCAIKNNLWHAVKSLHSTLNKYEFAPDEKNEMEMACLATLEEKIRKTDFQEEEEKEIGFFLLSQIEWTDQKWEEISKECRLLCLSILFHSSEYEKFIKELQIEGECFTVNTMLQMVFYFYELEITYQDNCYQSLFIDAWRALPSETKIEIRNYTDLGTTCVIDLITHWFPFVLEAKEYEDIKALLISLKTSLGFHYERWILLEFLIREEVAPIEQLEEMLEEYTPWDDVEIKRVLRFFRENGKQPLLQDPHTSDGSCVRTIQTNPKQPTTDCSGAAFVKIEKVQLI